MSDMTRPTGGTPAARGQHETESPDRRAAGTGPALDPDAPLGARSDHGAGVRAEATPHLRTEGRDGTTGALGTTGAPETPRASRTPGTAAPHASGAGTPLLPHGEYGKLEERLHHAVAGFVDGPRAAVEEADRVLEEITSRLTDAVTHRRRTLRESWRTADGGRDDREATAADTEQLRLALRDYRELSETLMRL
ncbi:hypothetical protein [Streptomyces daghestanicus]|uniref:Secreted protein n=1 Tax=Streptomyces daghestanicus TaxID=66885 RepID=A0ABQ3QB63_9ACTN|nr:hypothetical protein [Streptomyces daghestanicus]GGU44345.1 hypothetical protein GCM10010259_39150 [Streptomyces daghestanicus]GHI34506.1 hypothetical protein Sdagh_62360 [Streptomyces daghestanicus]